MSGDPTAAAEGALGEEELLALVLEMGTAMGWDQDGCQGTEDTKDWARVQNIINPPDNAQGAPQRARQIASWKGEVGVPLHWATYTQAPLEVVAALLKAFPEGAKEKTNVGKLPLQQTKASKPLVQTLSRIIWKGRHPLPRACLSDSLLHPLQEFAVRISCDHAAAVEFKLCIFSARNSKHHPLRHFVSVGYANAHARIESFLFPKTAVRRSMSQMLLN